MRSLRQKVRTGYSVSFRVLCLFVFLMPVLTASAQVVEQDSLALVALYNATDGPHWTNNTNWLQPGQPVSAWYGIDIGVGGIDENRVHDIRLSDNNLTGSLPDEIGNLTRITSLFLENNHLSGTIPASFANIRHLFILFLAGNDFTGDIPSWIFQVPLPDGVSGNPRIISLSQNAFTGITPWTGDFIHVNDIAIEDNRLDFDDIESLLPQAPPFFVYSPQAAIYSVDKITAREGSVLTLKASTPGSANHYQWLKDDVTIPSASQANHTWEVSSADEGTYTARVTNDLVTDLTLERNPVTLHVKEDTVYLSCQGATTLNVAVPDPQATYLWSTGATTSSIVAATTGKYGVRIETANYILKDTLDVVIPPILSLGQDIDTCEPSVVLSSNVSGDYQWHGPQGMTSDQPAITAAVDGRYILVVETDECVQKDTIEIVLDHFTEGDFTINAGDAVVDNNATVLTRIALSFTNTTGTGENFTFSFGDEGVSTEKSPLHSYGKNGDYTITLHGTDSRDCPITAERTIHVRELVITNAISPNGDGKNDKLYVEPFLYSAKLTIVNRWGQEVYRTTSYQDDFTGNRLESGVYYYELYFKEIDKSFKGYFQIVK